MDRHMFVRHEMYRDQTDEPRSTNFAKHMHVDKVSSPTNVQIIKVLDIHFQAKKSDFIRKFMIGYLAKRWRIWQKLRFTTLLVKYGLSIGIFIFDLDPFYRPRSYNARFDCEYLVNDKRQS